MSSNENVVNATISPNDAASLADADDNVPKDDGADAVMDTAESTDGNHATTSPVRAPLMDILSSQHHGITPMAATAAATGDAPTSATADATEEQRRLQRLVQEQEAALVAKKVRDSNQLELDEIFEKNQEHKFDDCPAFCMPQGFRPGIRLFPHQQDGIRWLVHQETARDRILPFYKQVELGQFKKKWWHCTLNQKKTQTPPFAPPSSILADDMGLGKTIQVRVFQPKI